MNHRKVVGIAAAFALIVLTPATVLASDIRFGETLLVSKEVISENFYGAGGRVVLSSEMRKDALVAGGEVTVDAPIAGDVFAAGGTVSILGTVSGDVRIVGGSVVVADAIAGDLVLVGGSVSLLPGAVVAGDLIVLGGAVFIDGTVNGNAKVVAGEVAVHGTIAGNLSARVGEGILLGEKSNIGGTFSYHAPQEADRETGAVVGGEVLFTQTSSASSHVGIAGVGAGFLIVNILSMVVAALAVLFVFPRLTRAVSESVYRTPWQDLGVGFVALITIPIFALVLLITFLGAYLGALLFVFYALVLMSAHACSGVVVGSLVARLFKKEPVSYGFAALGAVILGMLWFVPIVGWLVGTLAFLATLGALSREALRKIRSERA